jgi:MarR family transcriptional regulator, transcriptional regulator for hemolysin
MMALEQPLAKSRRPVHLLSFLLNDVARLYARRFEERTLAAGLTLTQCKVITLLSLNEGISQTRLAAISDIYPTTLVRIIDRMERDGMIERRDDECDRRAHQLHLGWAAQHVLPEITRFMDHICAEIFMGISEADQLHLLTTLEKLHEKLTSASPASGENTAETAPATTAAESLLYSNERPAADGKRRPELE